jgi:hypothetical protein
MQRRSMSRLRRHSSSATWLLAATATMFALSPIGVASATVVRGLKLPAEHTSSTGNFFTLEKYAPPSASKPVAGFEVKVCTSAHTPAGTIIEPALFTVRLSSGVANESEVLAAKPTLLAKPLKPLQCVEGWLAFSVPKGKAVVALTYEYNGKLTWTVG